MYNQGSARQREAAVLVAFCEREQHCLLTLRAQNMRQHGGEVAFPGGMREPSDKDLVATALRETFEEVGVPPALVKIVAQGAPRYTRQGTRVTPIQAEIPLHTPLQACPRELAGIFWLPLEWILEDRRERTDIFTLQGKEYWAPVYRFENFKIWGFTARLLVDVVSQHFGVPLGREHAVAPQVKFKC